MVVVVGVGVVVVGVLVVERALQILKTGMGTDENAGGGLAKAASSAGSGKKLGLTESKTGPNSIIKQFEHNRGSANMSKTCTDGNSIGYVPQAAGKRQESKEWPNSNKYQIQLPDAVGIAGYSPFTVTLGRFSVLYSGQFASTTYFKFLLKDDENNSKMK